MNIRRIKVQTEKSGSLARSEIWDSDRPHPIGFPIRAVLEHCDGGIRYRTIGDSAAGPRPAQVHEFSLDEIARGAQIDLPGHSGKVTLQNVHELRSPYIQRPEDLHEALGRGVPAVRAYAGSSGSLISSVMVASAYVGYSRNRPVFALYRDGRDFRLRALLPDLHIKYKGEAPQPLPIEQEISVKEEQLARATLVRGRYWWRVTFQTSSALDLPEEDDEKPVTFVDWGTRIAVVFSVIGVLWSSFVSETEVPQPPKQKEIRASAVVRVIGRRGTPNPAAMSPVAVSDQTPAPAGPAKNPVVAQTQTPQRAPAPPAPAPLQKAPLVVAPKPIARAATPSKTRATTQAQQTANSIQSALGQFLKSSAAPGALNPQANSVAPGGPGISQVQGYGSANLEASSLSGGGTTVARAGGSGQGNAAGYGAGNAGTVLGTRGGNGVALGTEGLPEERGLTKEEVGAVIHSHMNEVRYCYESALLSAPNLEGKLNVQFVISPQGDVSKAFAQSSSTGDKTVDQCIIGKLKTWKFPHPRGGIFVTITYPFLLKQLRRE